MRPALAYGLATLSGVLYFLAFAGFDLWPLAFVAFLPILHVLERDALPTRHAIGVGLWFGFVTNWGGYYWLVEMLTSFSGFPWLACVLFASVVCLYQGGQLAAFFLIARTVKRNGHPWLWLTPAIYAATERAYPLLFPSYYANCFHDLPWMIQVADLGGPTLLSALAVLWNIAAFDTLRAMRRARPWNRRISAVAVTTLLSTLAYGVYRTNEVEVRSAAAEHIKVGVVQADMGIFRKRKDPGEGLRRHVEQSITLEANEHVDLLVWPESAVVWAIPATTKRLTSLLSPLHTPVLFGGIARRKEGTERRIYNTAFMTDAEHNVRDTYDKTYLLAFGEYIPFGEMLPWLYELSPNTGHFTPGRHQRALPFGQHRISTLICYEDVLPGFTRDAVRTSDPHLLVNITNDSWFGDTHEPWIHLALAKFRAVEHHRFLVRATNSGVSAIVDATGRVITHSRTFQRENLHADVAMLNGRTLYGQLGDWPGWSGLAIALWFVARRRSISTIRSQSTPATAT